ncbi:MAG: SPOR domain-containing protein [Panacagrimonas sp.]
MEAPKPPPPKPIEAKPVEPKPAVPTPPKPPAASAPASPSGSGQVMVQAGAFSFLDKAEAVRERAGAQGQRCVVSPAETPKGTLYRLRCGPYADRAQAQAAANKLSAAGIAAQVVGGGR